MRDGYPLDERLTRVQEEFMPRAPMIPQQLSDADRESRLKELATRLRERVFGCFPQDAPELQPQWGEEVHRWGQKVREGCFEGWDAVPIKGWYSVPEHAESDAKLPGVVDIRYGEDISSWMHTLDKPQGYDWGERAVLVVDLLNNGDRAIDDSLEHQMRRQATIIGRSFDGMRVYELLRTIAMLRSLPGADPSRVTVIGKGTLGVDGLYAAMLAPGVPVRAVVEEPTDSHTEGPYLVGILRETDVPEVISLLGGRVKVVGHTPPGIESYMKVSHPGEQWHCRNVAEALK